MAAKKISQLESRLRDLYRQDAHARALLDHLAQRGKNPRGWQTRVDQAYEIIATADASATYAEARAVLENLAGVPCGKFVLGRRGYPTRLVWEIDAISAGKVAKGEAEAVAAAADEDAPPPGMMDVEYPLRDEQTITLRLPRDLSEREAERLAKFIISLPK